MSWREYISSVRVTAKGETTRYLKEQVRVEVLIAIALFLSGLIVPTEPWQKVVAAIVVTLLGLLILCGVVLVWSLIWAPVNLARADKERIRALESFSNPELDVIASFPAYHDDGTALYIVLTEVHIINRSDRRVNLDVDLDISVEQEDGSYKSTITWEMYIPNKAVDSAIPDDYKRGGILHSPLVIEAKDRAVGYFIFKVDAEMRKEISLDDFTAIRRVELDLVDGVTNISKTYPVPDTMEEIIALHDQKSAEKDGRA